MKIKDVIQTLSQLDENLTVDAKVTRDISQRSSDILNIDLRIIKPIMEEVI